MSVIAICGASQCESEKVARMVADKLSYKYIGKELLENVANKNKLSLDDIDSTIKGKTSMFGISEKDRRKIAAFIKHELAETIKSDDLVVHSPAVYMLPKEISHILRVCLVADFDWRVDKLVKAGKSEKHARHILKEDDEMLFNWAAWLHGVSPWAKRLFDIIEPMQDNSSEKAADLIINNVQKQILQPTPDSLKALQDFALAARVNAILAQKKHDCDTMADGSKVTVYVQTYTLRMEHYQNELKKLVQSIDGVSDAEVSIGKKINLPSNFPSLDFDIPKKVLLVDDEVEFIQTLSERLQTRKFDSRIAYNGEEALASIKEEQPEVMVLDLKMPGISGLDVLRDVKKNHPATEVIILTGHGSEKERQLAEDLGAFAYLEKPVDINILSETMQKAYAKINRQQNSE